MIISDVVVVVMVILIEIDVFVVGGFGLNVNMIFGVVFGFVFGLVFILGLIYFCLQRCMRQQVYVEVGYIRRFSGVFLSEKDGIGYVKDSFVFGQGLVGVFWGYQF